MEAIKWYRKALLQDYLSRRVALGFLLAESSDAEDIKEAIALFEPFAEKGNSDALYVLCRLYFKIGEHATALYWFQEAAFNGNDGCKQAIESLGKQLMDGFNLDE